jgi:ribosomal 30S subunit maturation factor RimM
VSDWIRLGTIGRAHGLRGSFFISGRDEPLPQSLMGRQVLVGASIENAQTMTLLKADQRSNGVTASLEGVTSRESVEVLKGRNLWGRRLDLHLKSDEVLVGELKGLTVFDDTGAVVGVVESVLFYPGDQMNLNVVKQRSDGRWLEMEISWGATYIDAYRTTDLKAIYLSVSGDVFDELWTLRRGAV